MNKKYIVILLSILILCLPLPVNAQVTIGSEYTPLNGSILDLKEVENSDKSNTTLVNSEKGVLFPRVELKDMNSIYPLYKDENPDSPEVKKFKRLYTGMVVYCISEQFDQGLYVWNGKEWKSLANSLSGNAEFDLAGLDCNQVKVEGIYNTRYAVNEISHYLTIPLKVNKKGKYSIMAAPENDNGYYFMASGEAMFDNMTLPIKVPAFGQPATPTSQRGNVPDKIKIVVNGKELLCDLSVYVSGSPDYVITDPQIRAQGSYNINKKLDANNTISIKINNPASSAGIDYHIKTATVNGFYFEGKGTLTSGNQVIILEAEGTAQQQGKYEFAIELDNEQKTKLTAEVLCTVRPVNILGIGAAGYTTANNIITKGLLNKDNFGTISSVNGDFSESKYYIDNINILPRFESTVTAADLEKALRADNAPDIIITGYPTEAYFDKARFDLLARFVNSGGVLIYQTDSHLSYKEMINRLLAYSAFASKIDNNDPASIRSGNPISDQTLFGSLAGTTFYPHAAGNFNINGIFDYETYTVADVAGNARVFMHKTKGFVYIGDGGPIYMDTNTNFYLNTMTWALNFVSESRPTGGPVIR